MDMKYKAIVMDIDGTLYNSEKAITPSTKKALFKARERGVTIAVATGRPLHGVRDVARELRLREKGGYIISYNGGKIVDAKKNEIISETFLAAEYVSRIEALAEKYNAPLVVHTPDALLTGDIDDKFINLEARLNKMPLVKFTRHFADSGYKFFKCIITGEADRASRLEKIFADEFKGELSVYRSEPYFLEILPLGIDKAGAISALSSHLGISDGEIIACGDGFNDISMIEAAGLGVAMANAQQSVIDAADFVTLSCDDDGLVPVIEKYLLHCAVG